MNPAGLAGTRVRRRAAAPELPCRAEPELFFAADPRDLQRAKELCGRPRKAVAAA
jgi:hypothetical protein